MAESKVNMRGLKCPLPALKTRKLLSKLAAGELLVIECTDPLTAIDIPNLIRETGDKVEITERNDARIAGDVQHERRCGRARGGAEEDFGAGVRRCAKRYERERVSESVVAIRPKIRFWRAPMRRQRCDHENFFIAKPRDSESVRTAFSRNH